MFFKTNLPNFSTFLMNSLYFFAPPDQNINRKNQVNKDPHIFFEIQSAVCTFILKYLCQYTKTEVVFQYRTCIYYISNTMESRRRHNVVQCQPNGRGWPLYGFFQSFKKLHIFLFELLTPGVVTTGKLVKFFV